MFRGAIFPDTVYINFGRFSQNLGYLSSQDNQSSLT